MIKAIPTSYAGYRFRSRLEARWAVFFDTLEIKWQFEPEGFELSPLSKSHILKRGNGFYSAQATAQASQHLGYYLPDFWLPEQEAWFEVKGAEPPADEQARLARFADLTSQRVFIAVGSIPDPRTIDAFGPPRGEGFEIRADWDTDYAWTQCSWCGLYDLQFEARSARTRCRCHKNQRCGTGHRYCDRCHNGAAAGIIAAYKAARSARFEHGERGA